MTEPNPSFRTETRDTEAGWIYVSTPAEERAKLSSWLEYLTDPWRGWRVIVFGSWINGLLVLLPVLCALHLIVPQEDVVIFVLCILAMVPLVKLHDLATCELALRIGGSKTGLVKASLSNVVELVVAVSALRKCELRVVQSSLIGSMLSGLLLVLGTGLLAGGLRFSDQSFDLAATQVQASLLGFSVGVLLLPAAYHFSLGGQGSMIKDEQKRDILRMSHGVSVVLLAMHISYTLFQLWSHNHLYRDVDTSNNKLIGKRFTRSASFLQPTCSLWYTGDGQDLEKYANDMNSRTPSASSVTLGPLRSNSYLRASGSSSEILSMNSDTGMSPDIQLSTSPPISMASKSVRLVQKAHSPSLQREISSGTQQSILSTSSLLGGNMVCGREVDRAREEISDMASLMDQGNIQIPLLSWPMAVLLLISVTVLLAVNADWLVNSMNGSISTVIDKQWIGLILLPAVSAIAECVSAVNISFKDQLPLSVSVAVGSTIQTVLFVIPFTVTLAWVLGKPLALLFDPFESVILYISVQTMSYVIARGRSSWLEGIELICLYVIIAVAFWYYPVSDISSTLAICTTTS